MESQTQKHKRSSVGDVGRDRLSEMPDEVIIHILSCMPIVYAVRTMLLRRFGDLWTLVHTLKLDMRDFFKQFYLDHQREEDENERMFVFVRNVLILHRRPSINIFHIRIEFPSFFSDETIKGYGEAKTWVRFALGRQAKELILCDMSENDIYEDFFSYYISVRNFTSQSLVTLMLVSCNVETRVQVNLPSLNKLSMTNCAIQKEVLLRFMRGCPSLQELEIKESYCMDQQSLSAPNIDKLSLVLSYSCDSSEPLLFDCPNLKTLYLDTSVGLDITDISSVREIYIKNVPGDEYNKNEHTKLKYFYVKLDGAEVLHLSWSVSHEFLDTVQHMHLLQHKWKRVVLEFSKFDQICLVGLYHLMRSLRNLEELIIYTTPRFEAYGLLPLEDLSPHVTPQLKTITLHGYGRTWKSQLRLVEFLLKGAAVLDKLIIVATKHQRHPRWNAKPAEEFEFVKLVSSFPRASTSARVLFA